MRFVHLIAVAALCAAACGKAETPDAPAEGAAPEAAAEAAPAPAPAEAAKAAEAPAKPAPAEPKPAAGAPAAQPAAQGLASLDDSPATMKDLESKPGGTPALVDVLVAPEQKREELKGKPGESAAVGPADAPVKVYVFSDFQCPVCRRVVEPIKALHRAFPDKVQIIFKHNALEMHQFANVAATAAIAAQRQGKFWAYHDKAFQNYRNLHQQDLILYAEELGLDVKKFEADMKDPKVQAQVNYERDLAEALGMRGTPGFYINGKKSIGWGSYGGFKIQVARAIKAAQEIEASTGKKGHDLTIEATRVNGADGKLFAKLVYGVE